MMARSSITGILTVVAALAAIACSASCRRQTPAAKPALEMIWRPVGSWSGHGNRQTESFTSDSGALRVHWQTKPITGAPATDGLFRLTAHSAISGRILQQVVDEHGAGSGVDYVSQDPHVFYMSVESAALDWTFSVEEGIAGEAIGHAGR
jgi:hypothetical protein